MSTTAAPHPAVPLPAGVTADEWQDVPTYRVIFGPRRQLGDRENTFVDATAVQFPDGTISDGSNDAPRTCGLTDAGIQD